MSEALGSQMAQAVALSATSNLLAQTFATYQSQKAFVLDISALGKYVAYGLLNTPPNAVWQQFLEDRFPSSVDDKGKNEGVSMSTRNLIVKFVLDQTIGAIFNILLFIVATNVMNGAGMAEMVEAVKQDSLEIYTSGLVIWPLVSLVSFVAVPVQRRVVFGSMAGILWGVYLSLVSLRNS